MRVKGAWDVGTAKDKTSPHMSFFALRASVFLNEASLACDNIIRIMEDKTYSVTLKSKTQLVLAATVKTEGGRLIFTNAAGEVTGNFDAKTTSYIVSPPIEF